MRRWLHVLSIRTIQWALFWLWAGHGVAGAGNVLMFYMWLVAPLSVLVLAATCGNSASTIKSFSAYSSALARTAFVLDVLLVAALVWHGAIGTGLAALTVAIAMWLTREISKDEARRAQASA